jgi:predicted hydrocarbon binding protein
MSRQEANVKPLSDGRVSAAFPLALLESVRSHDRPGEILEDEDLTISLPRRLGLTGVIETQIFRYEAAQKAGRAVRVDEVMSLIRLVMRRPDAEPILRETGQRMARWHFRHAPALWSRVLHRAPAPLGLRSARRAAARALRSLQAGSAINALKPFVIRISDCTAAQLEESGLGCTLVTGLIEEQLLLSTGKPRRVRHTCCLAHGNDLCEWELIEA